MVKLQTSFYENMFIFNTYPAGFCKWICLVLPIWEVPLLILGISRWHLGKESSQSIVLIGNIVETPLHDSISHLNNTVMDDLILLYSTIMKCISAHHNDSLKSYKSDRLYHYYSFYTINFSLLFYSSCILYFILQCAFLYYLII
jgi:hypothetical protein